MPVLPEHFGLQNFAFPVVSGGGGGTGTGVLAAVNNGDGTMTVSITAGTDGTVTISAGTYGSGSIGDWTDLGTITVSGGTGEADFTVDPGAYILLGYMGTAPYGNPVYVVVTTATSGWRSPIRAVIAFYNDMLSAANFPDGVKPGIYFAEGPGTKYTTNANLVPPYIILEDGGDKPTPAPRHSQPWAVGLANTILAGSFKLKVYYIDLGDADDCNWALMWNGASPQSKQGLAFCQLNMKEPLYSLPFNCVPTTSWRGYAGFQYENERVHVVEQGFDREIHLCPQGIS